MIKTCVMQRMHHKVKTPEALFWNQRLVPFSLSLSARRIVQKKYIKHVSYLLKKKEKETELTADILPGGELTGERCAAVSPAPVRSPCQRRSWSEAQRSARTTSRHIKGGDTRRRREEEEEEGRACISDLRSARLHQRPPEATRSTSTHPGDR